MPCRSIECARSWRNMDDRRRAADDRRKTKDGGREADRGRWTTDGVSGQLSAVCRLPSVVHRRFPLFELQWHETSRGGAKWISVPP